MPIGSSKFFRNRQAGVGTGDFVGYPGWPALPNANVFYDFVDNFEPTATGTTVTLTTESAIPTTVNGNVVNSPNGYEKATMTTVPNGNVYITIGLDTGHSSDSAALNKLFVYDTTTSNITALTGAGSNTFGHISAMSSILHPDENKVLHFNETATFPTMTDITSSTSTVTVSDGPRLNRDPAGVFTSLLYDRAILSQSSGNVIFVRTGGASSGDLATMCNIADDQNNPFGVEVANMVHTSMKLSTGPSGSFSVAIAEHPRTGNIYYAGANSGYFTFQEYDPLSNVTSDYVPSGASTLFADTTSNDHYFGTACLGVDEHIYFLPKDANGIMVFDAVSNVANAVITEANTYIDAKLGLDGNIYALQFGTGTTGAGNDLLMIDTTPTSPTYQQLTYLDTGVGTNAGGGTFWTAIGVAGDGTILGVGTDSNASANVNQICRISTNGRGYNQVIINPYLNGHSG